MNSDNPHEIRSRIRAGQWMRPTSGLAAAYAQANLVMLDRKYAFEFLLFCQRNPKPCPVLEVLDAGEREPRITAPLADITTDIPLYRAWKKGNMSAEVPEISDYFNQSMVSFLLGCSFTFEHALSMACVPVRNVEEGKNVSMYITNRKCIPAGAVLGAAGSQYEAHSRRARQPCRPGDRPLRIRSRCAGAHRKPEGTRHSRPEQPGFRRPGHH